jgi:lactate racemase
MIGKGYVNGWLVESEIERILDEGLASLPIDGKRVLIIVPDDTRSMPLPLFFRLILKKLIGRVCELNFLIALGTHPPMSTDAIQTLFGISSGDKNLISQKIGIFNHDWSTQSNLELFGTIPAEVTSSLSFGWVNESVPVRLNRAILEHDHVIICGPVFPHEVAGFSGGNKYFFPGIAGAEIINLMHWIGALHTSNKIIGIKDSPTRQIIDLAASYVPIPKSAFCCVVDSVEVNQKYEARVAGLFFGSPESAFQNAADLSAQMHILWCDHPYKKVLSVLPEMYKELWVGAKGMYKVEPVIVDGGEVVIYAPHIREISLVHGDFIRKIGYHVRDYYLNQWDRFSGYPWSVLAHSTHLRGIGTYENGRETPRIRVTLATGIPEEICKAVNLGYQDPEKIDPLSWASEGVSEALVVPRGGEHLYRLMKECEN